MTAEEAIEIIEDYQVNGCGYCHTGGKEVEEAFRMAVEALKEQNKRKQVCQSQKSSLTD